MDSTAYHEPQATRKRRKWGRNKTRKFSHRKVDEEEEEEDLAIVKKIIRK
jgi:hypothetical protein